MTDTQAQVLIAVNDYLDIHEGWVYSQEVPLHEQLPLEDTLTDQEVGTALADLRELGLIEGIMAANWRFPIRITRLTARGRQALP